MLQHITHYRKRYVSAGLLLADIVLFTGVDPQRASAPWLIIGFVLLGLTIWCLINIIGSWIATKELSKSRHRFSRYAAALITMCIGLQSVGQLTMRDTVAIVPFIVVAYAYFGYGRRPNREQA